MNDKSLLSRYHQGDVYIIKDKKPTPGTTGEHPYLVISNESKTPPLLSLPQGVLPPVRSTARAGMRVDMACL